MKRRTSLCASGAVLILLFSLAVRAEAVTSPGFISASSSPSGAAVSLDFSPTGFTTPVTLDLVMPGSHMVSVSLAGYVPVNKVVDVSATVTSFVYFNLVSDLWSGYLEINDTWNYLWWLGYFSGGGGGAGGGWIYHADHGRMYALGTDAASSIFFWTPDMGWLWTRNDLYPFLWRYAGSGTWLWYYQGTSRWFYNYQSGSPEWHAIQ